jgi:hypothetical protein
MNKSTSHRHSFWHKHLMWLKLAAAVYVVGLIVSHAMLPAQYIWAIAVFFSIVMNFVYPIEARSLKAFVTIESLVATLLILMSLVSLLASPLFVIAAIFGHGVWDLLKHRGQGVRFFSWYVLGCVTVDWIYAGTLFVWWSMLPA